MVKIEVKQPTEEELTALGIKTWGIWTKEVSTFEWEYDSKEIFYVLEGEAEIEADNERIPFKAGDLLLAMKGLNAFGT